MSEVRFLVGGKVHLRPMEPSDLPHVRKWVNDTETRRFIGEIRPKSMADAAVRFYEKCGFKREGAQRHGYYCDGRYHDVIMMSILEGEFRESEAKGA